MLERAAPTEQRCCSRIQTIFSYSFGRCFVHSLYALLNRGDEGAVIGSMLGDTCSYMVYAAAITEEGMEITNHEEVLKSPSVLGGGGCISGSALKSKA